MATAQTRTIEVLDPWWLEDLTESQDDDDDGSAGESFEPNSFGQWRVLVSPAKQVVWSSAYAKGKTRGICEAADLDCRSVPGNRVVLARKTLASMWHTTLKVLLEEVINPDQRQWGWRPHGQGGATLRYENGSEMLCFGLDNPERARSGAYGSAYVDQAEELSEEEGDAIAGRLRLRRARRRRLVMACNPAHRRHWIFRRFRPDRVRPGQLQRLILTKRDVELPNGEVVPSGSLHRELVLSGRRDNVANVPSDYLFEIASYKGRYGMRYRDGEWVDFEGLVYDHFDEDLHVIARPKSWAPWGGFPPPTWPRFRAIDFGFENPFVFQWYAQRPGTRRLYLYREIYKTHTLVDQHATEILRLEHHEWKTLIESAGELGQSPGEVEELIAPIRGGLNFEATVADHDKEDRYTLHRRGIITEPAMKQDVVAGIKSVYRQLAPDAQGKPGLYFVRDAVDQVDPLLDDQEMPTCTHEEIGSYRWLPEKEGKPLREEPEGLDDHGADACRYLIHTLVLRGEL